MFFPAILMLTASLIGDATDTLQTSIVSAERGITVSRCDTIPAAEGAGTVTDILMKSPGLMVTDCGGAAGLKTVSLRGLGSPHTTIYIDGIRVGNVQSGQPDLGMLPLENLSGAVIDYAQNSINFTTSRPRFQGRRVGGRAAFSGGSFGTYLPSARLDIKLSEKVAMSLCGAGVISKGDFPVEVEGGAGEAEAAGGEAANILRRQNNDISQARAGVDLFGLLGGGDWTAKVCYNWAERGTPGSLSWPSTDRQKDHNAFAQAHVRNRFSPLYSLDISAKVSFDKVSYSSQWGDSDYGQTEAQLNSAHKFHISRWLDLSAAALLQYDNLASTYYSASRAGASIIAGAAFSLPLLRADITLQYDGVFDIGSFSSNTVSPSADIRFTPVTGLDIVAFARRAYRTPTFNELYYPGYGNPDLKPEDAWLTDLGVQYVRTFADSWTLKAKIDGFCNYLQNKITSAPSPDDPSLWMPYNIDKVICSGLDADAGLGYAAGAWTAALSARYSLQCAKNVPYLSRHTVILSADASWRGWALGLLWNWRAGRTDSYGPMPDWNTLDLDFSKAIGLPGCGPLTLRLTCRNLADCRYELSSGYPMPGRSLLGGIEFRF